MDVLRLSVRKTGPAAWQVSYAISLWYQSKPRVSTVWIKWPISFYSGKDLCTAWGRNSIVAVLHKGCIAHIVHRCLTRD